jgi:hypothetical protein
MSLPPAQRSTPAMLLMLDTELEWPTAVVTKQSMAIYKSIAAAFFFFFFKIAYLKHK